MKKPGSAKPPLAVARTWARMVYHLALADFRDRTRRYSFLIILALVTYLGYTVNTGEFSLKLGDYQGINNSAWVGAQMVLVVTFVLSLFGFYLVKNSIERDTRTGVGQIIATTPISRVTYLLGKGLSHFLLLAVLVLLLGVAALVMQLLRHEAAVDAWALVAPFLFVALPCMALIAGIAVFFEAVPFLRGGLGNILFFVGWLFLIAMIIEGFLAAGRMGSTFPDPLGLGALIPSMQAALHSTAADYDGGFSLSVSPGRVLTPFLWPGMDWTAALVLRQWAWAAVAIGLTLLGAPIFERFDPSRMRPRQRRNPHPQPLSQGARGASKDLFQRERGASADLFPSPGGRGWREAPGEGSFSLTPLHGVPSSRTFFTVFLAEVRLLLKGWQWWWYAIAAGLAAAAVFSPLEVVRAGLLPAAWIWPILLWSGMGCREEKHLTQQIIFSTARPIWRQLPAAWLAGVAVTAVAGSGALLAFFLAGNAPALLGWLSGVLFIPSLALALGVWTRTNRVFEIVYLLIWYLGPVQSFPALDFSRQPVFGLIGIGLFVAALIGRGRFQD